jgi:hypothetical protein
MTNVIRGAAKHHKKKPSRLGKAFLPKDWKLID